MNSIFFLFLRRLRKPLITIIVSYTIAITGLVLIPGVDSAGKPIYLSLFEAFYVITYTATTIGFGEIPFSFSNNQRLWLTFSIYLTVIPWFYAIGKIVALFQDSGLKSAITSDRFARHIKNLHEPFYIVCGYGETGSLLVKSLDRNEVRVVVLEVQQDRINELELEDLQFAVPNLCADASLPENLIRAGIQNPACKGVAALTDHDQVNLAITVAAKLINPNIMVIGRAENDKTAANMASFGTNHTINPFTMFGEHLAMEMHSIGTYLLHEWLTGLPGETVKPPVVPPTGKWIVCGYGRFGKSVVENLLLENNQIVIIEADPELTQCAECIVGNGTESEVLALAGVEEAVGIVAGTNEDINNLAIVMTALERNPNLFVVVRKNRRFNDHLFERFSADITMQPSSIIAHACLAHMISPLLAQFLLLSRTQTNDWANQLISRLVELLGEAIPETWEITINQAQAPSAMMLFAEQESLTLAAITRNPVDHQAYLQLAPLLLSRDGQMILLPDLSTHLQVNDKLLFCGRDKSKATLAFLLHDYKSLRYVVHGHETSDSWIWRWFSQK